jgi:hypothetical protein
MNLSRDKSDLIPVLHHTSNMVLVAGMNIQRYIHHHHGVKSARRRRRFRTGNEILVFLLSATISCSMLLFAALVLPGQQKSSSIMPWQHRPITTTTKTSRYQNTTPASSWDQEKHQEKNVYIASHAEQFLCLVGVCRPFHFLCERMLNIDLSRIIRNRRQWSTTIP